ncbi:MAG: hypothetical protein ACPKM0_11950 [Pleomorphochaeta sp.]
MATQSFTNTYKITANYGLKNLNKAFEKSSPTQNMPSMKIEKKTASKKTIREILNK